MDGNLASPRSWRTPGHFGVIYVQWEEGKACHTVTLWQFHKMLLFRPFQVSLCLTRRSPVFYLIIVFISHSSMFLPTLTYREDDDVTQTHTFSKSKQLSLTKLDPKFNFVEKELNPNGLYEWFCFRCICFHSLQWRFLWQYFLQISICNRKFQPTTLL